MRTLKWQCLPPEISMATIDITVLSTLASLSCHTPSIWEIAIILPLIIASSAFAVTTTVGVIGIYNVLIPLVIGGANLEAIAAALGINLSVSVGSMEALGTLVVAIQQILGCS